MSARLQQLAFPTPPTEIEHPPSLLQEVGIAREEDWSSGNYDQSIDLLAPDLTVEVPINDYPTADSFAQARRKFGAMVKHCRAALRDGQRQRGDAPL